MLAPVESDVSWGSPASGAKVTTVKIVTDYPFGDNATIFVTGAAQLEVRIPGWAVSATLSVNGAKAAPVANGTMHAIDATRAASTTVQLFLNPTVRIEKGWGRAAKNGSALVAYAAAGATVPSAEEQDWDLSLVATASARSAVTTAQVCEASAHLPHSLAALMMVPATTCNR